MRYRPTDHGRAIGEQEIAAREPETAPQASRDRADEQGPQEQQVGGSHRRRGAAHVRCLRPDVHRLRHPNHQDDHGHGERDPAAGDAILGDRGRGRGAGRDDAHSLHFAGPVNNPCQHRRRRSLLRRPSPRSARAPGHFNGSSMTLTPPEDKLFLPAKGL